MPANEEEKFVAWEVWKKCRTTVSANQRGGNITGNNRTAVHLGPIFNLCRVVTVCYLHNTRSWRSTHRHCCLARTLDCCISYKCLMFSKLYEQLLMMAIGYKPRSANAFQSIRFSVACLLDLWYTRVPANWMQHWSLTPYISKIYWSARLTEWLHCSSPEYVIWSQWNFVVFYWLLMYLGDGLCFFAAKAITTS
jgi:hypothetical protein